LITRWVPGWRLAARGVCRSEGHPPWRRPDCAGDTIWLSRFSQPRRPQMVEARSLSQRNGSVAVTLAGPHSPPCPSSSAPRPIRWSRRWVWHCRYWSP